MGLLDFSPAQSNTADRKTKTIDSGADSDISSCGHVLLGILFYGALIAYAVILIITYINTPNTQINTVHRASEFNAVALEVSASCADGWCGPAELVLNYSDPSIREECRRKSGTFPITYGTPMGIPLCVVPDEDLSTIGSEPTLVQGVMVRFLNFSSGKYSTTLAEVTVKAVRGPSDASTVKVEYDTGFQLQRSLSVGAEMTKSLNLGMFVETRDDVVSVKAPYAINFQMEGTKKARADGFGLSELYLRLQPQANVREVSSTRDALVLLGEIGGAYESLEGVFLLIIPIIATIFAVRRATDSDDGADDAI